MSEKRKYRNCCVFGCLNTTRGNDKSFFKLPPTEERRIEWLKLILRDDLIDRQAAGLSVCEDHFDPESILTSPNRKVLKRNAFPRRMLPDRKYEDKTCQTNMESKHVLMTCEMASQTPLYLLNNTARMKKLKHEISVCKKKLKTTKSNYESKGVFHNLCDKFLNKKLAGIVKEQTKLKLHSSGNKYTIPYKIFCLNLFHVSPQAYGLLKDMLCLPSRPALKSMYAPMNNKVDNYLMKVFQAKVKDMSELEKNCSLVLNAMSLKSKLFYNIKDDRVYGFHEVDGVQSAEPARYALVAMIHGMFVNYQQPVGYALVAESKQEDIDSWIDKLIQKLQEIGLYVRVFVSDLGSDILNIAKKRLVSAERPYFYVNNRKIYYVFDPPSLIRSVRDDLMNYDFYFNHFVAKWDHILEFYESEKTKQLRYATKLTESHVKPTISEKNEVKYAVQVLSATVAEGLATYKHTGTYTAPELDGTIHLIRTMNNLFDFLNSSSRYGSNQYQHAFSAEDYQKTYIAETLEFLASLKVINRKNGKDVTSGINFIEGFQITLKAIPLLFEELKVEGYTHIMTKKLNQDCLENFFHQVRTRNGNTTSWQLVSAFQKYFFVNIIKPTKEGNCNEDIANSLLEGQQLYDNLSNKQMEIEQGPTSIEADASGSEHNEDIDMPSAPSSHTSVTTKDYDAIELPEKNAFYVSSYLLKKCLAQHKDCDLMKFYINFSQDTECNRYEDFCKDGGDQLSIIPPEDFVKFVESMGEQFAQFFNENFSNTHLLKGLLEKVKHVTFSMPCPCFPLAYCKKLYLRMRIYYTLKYNNRAFRTCRNKRNKCFSVVNL